jgi:hypothetical protein
LHIYYHVDFLISGETVKSNGKLLVSFITNNVNIYLKQQLIDFVLKTVLITQNKFLYNISAVF